MALSPTESAQQGAAYAVALHGVLQQQSVRTKCPVALLQTLLALHAMNAASSYFLPTTGQLNQVMQLSLPLLRGYLRDLVTRGLVRRERFYRRGPQLLHLTGEGRQVAVRCLVNLKQAAAQVLAWELTE
jgi:DNA-binding MarR family transcriptional regulator